MPTINDAVVDIQRVAGHRAAMLRAAVAARTAPPPGSPTQPRRASGDPRTQARPTPPPPTGPTPTGPTGGGTP